VNSYRDHVCYLCFSENSGLIGRNHDFKTDIFICNDCGLIQNDFVSHLYLNEYYHKRYREARKEVISEKYLEFMSLRASSQNQFILGHLPSTARLTRVLDIGASAGKLLGTFHGLGDLYAVESDPDMRSFLESSGTITLLDESVAFSGEYASTFDLVMLSHVFEHINNPLEYLYKLFGLISSAGFLFLEVPNEPIELVTHNVKKRKKGIGHLFDYTVATLNKVISESNLFDVVAMKTFSVSISDYLKGASIRNFEENPSGNGIHIRCLLRKKADAAKELSFDQHRYIDAVLTGQYRRQLRNERLQSLGAQAIGQVQLSLRKLRR
jgi:trans-aconitate methyltransferase